MTALNMPRDILLVLYLPLGKSYCQNERVYFPVSGQKNALV